MKCAGLTTILLIALAGCGVKPPLRYVSPEDTLHEVGFVERSAAGVVQPTVEGAPTVTEPPAVRPVARPEDAARAHYATAVGLQAACHFEEALAHYRGYLSAQPQGEFAARALVRMATIYLEPGYRGRDPERARALIAEVTARFPASAAATVARELQNTEGF